MNLLRWLSVSLLIWLCTAHQTYPETQALAVYQHHITQSAWGDNREALYLNESSHCLRKYFSSSVNRNPPNKCSRRDRQDYEQTLERYVDPLKTFGERFISGELSCTYSWFGNNLVSSRENGDLQIHLQADACGDKKVFPEASSGGASFEVLAISVEKIVDIAPSSLSKALKAFYCEVQDGFNAIYTVVCPKEALEETKKVAIIPVFDFEGFKAYLELPYNAEQRVVGTATTPASESRYGLLVEQGTGGSSAATLVELPKLRNFDDLVAKIAPQPPLPSLQHGFPTNDEIIDETGASKYRRCLIRPERPVKFLGDSHLRYVFDHLVGRYIAGSKDKFLSLPHHHAYVKFPDKGDTKSGYISYFPYRFLYQLSILLGQCNHDGGSEITTLVVGPGAWDLDYAPLRDALQNHEYAQKLMDSLRMLLTKCEKKFRILWVTTPPNPCNAPNTNFAHGLGFRNNYAISAFNQHFLREIEKIQVELRSVQAGGEGPSVDFRSSIVVVDAFQMIYPHCHEVVCKNHYLCWEVGSTDQRKAFIWRNTHAGLVLAEKVLETLCKE